MKSEIDENIPQNFHSNILFVSELPKGTKIEDLEILFNKYQFIQASLKNSTVNKIWAQVILESETWANKARHELNGTFLIPLSENNDKSKGRPIRICKYESKHIQNNKKDIDYNKNLLVKNIDAKMSQMEFYKLFLKYGDILSGKIEYEENGLSKGYGYIYYYDEESAEKAKKDLNNKEFYGKKIEVVNLIPSKIKNNNKITLFVLNLPNNITEKEIKSIFGKYGEILYISLTNKGYAFINYSTYESASACLSDIKTNPIGFSGQPNLIVKFATSKEERELNKNSFKNFSKNKDACKIFFKLINNEEIILNIFDLDKKIRLFIKIIFITEYIPTSVEVNEEIRCGIVTFNNIKDCEVFINKFKDYCNYKRPTFNCIPYSKIKNQITDNFINLENYQNLNANQKINDSNHNEIDSTKKNMNVNQINENNTNTPNNIINPNLNNNKINNYNNIRYNNNNNKINNVQLPNNIPNNNNNTNYKNMLLPNYSQINNLYNPKNHYFQQFNYYKKNNILINNNYNNNQFILNNNLNNNRINKNMNNNLLNNSNNNNNRINNNENKNLLNKNNKIDENQDTQKNENEDEKILLKSWEFNSPAKCYYNAYIQKDDINEENLIEISDSIYQIVYDIHPKEAGKITGMIKELGLNKMNLLLSKPDDLNQIIEKAYNMIIETKNN